MRCAICLITWFCLVVCACAQELKEMQITEVPASEARPVVVLERIEAILVVHTNLAVLSFDSNLGIITVDPVDQGIYHLHLQPGTHLISFKAQGYRTQQERIYIDRQQSKQYNVTGAAAEGSGARGTVRLETEPSGANVVWNNITLQDKTPLMLSDQPAGLQTVRLELSGYAPLDTTLKVTKDKTTTHRFKLAKVFARLKVSSDPPGATVYLDGDSIGRTPLERNDLSPGDGVLLLKLSGYISNSQSIRLLAGERKEFNVDLFPQLGKVEITTSPPGAQVFLDGQAIGTYQTSPLVVDKVSLGRHTVSATLAGYADTSATFAAVYNQTAKIELKLWGNPGALFINSTPDGAAIILDGRNTSRVTPSKLTDIAAGDHEVVLQLKGYADLRRAVKVTPAKVETVDEKLSETVFQKTAGNPSTVEDMVLVPAGSFSMGSNKLSGDAKPEHKIYLDAYYIDKYEVTNQQYKSFCDQTGHAYPPDAGFAGISDYFFKYPNYPVVRVSWDDAQAYAVWAGKRLPTEAEWERAAKGNEYNRLYPWGDNVNASHANIAGTGDGYVYTAPVGSFPDGISPVGCYDMAGNVWEWCSDRYSSTYYSSSPTRNPQGPFGGSNRVLRGGSWNSSSSYASRAYRGNFLPSYQVNNFGFRCARTP
jgi:formylglycine-generating enzyme required for sulfatase activity